MPSVITTHRFSELAKRLFKVTGPSPLQDVLEDVMPMLELRDAYRPEERFLRGERRGSIGIQSSVITTQSNLFTIVNPQGSGKLAVVKSVQFACQIPTSTVETGSILFSISSPQPTAIAPIATLTTADSRVAPQGAFQVGMTTGYVLTRSSGTVGGPNAQHTKSVWSFDMYPGPAIVPFQRDSPDLDIVLMPGFLVDMGVYVTTLPTAFFPWSVSVQCYERGVESTEANTVGV